MIELLSDNPLLKYLLLIVLTRMLMYLRLTNITPIIQSPPSTRNV